MSSVINDMDNPSLVKPTRLSAMVSGLDALSDYVRRIAYEKRLSYREIAKRTGQRISHGTVSDIINRRSKDIKAETLKALALGLGVPEEEIFAIARGKAPEPMSPTDFYSALQVMGVEQFQAYGGVENLTDEDRQEIIAVLGTMIEQKLIRRQSARKPTGKTKK